MRFGSTQIAFFLSKQTNRRNMAVVLRFILFMLAMITLYSVLFHSIMLHEGREYSPVTGLYWTLTVMSTLGFGDITFQSDMGRAFTIVVLLSGVLFFMLVLPFTFIRYVYSPWLEARAGAETPREVPPGTSGHVIVAGAGDMAMNIVERLRRYSIPYVLLSDEEARALSLHENGYNAVFGALDDSAGYEKFRINEASLLLALHDDLKNTNIVATVREASKTVRIAAGIEHEPSRDILTLAGCNYVIHFSRLLGQGLARRVFNASMESNIIGRFDGLCIAESSAQHTPFVGKTLVETNFRGRFGLNVAGIMHENQYRAAGPDTLIKHNDVLLLAGTEEKLKRYDAQVAFEDGIEQPPVLILGGGRVGSAVAEALEARYIPFRIVEQRPALIPDAKDERYVLGNAAEIDTLIRAGIEHTNTVVVTTHNDDLNIYLTIYCRKLRPDIRIISRAAYDKNVDSLYNAGAGLVMSQAGVVADMVTNLLIPGRVFMLTEGFNVFRVDAPRTLQGVSLMHSGIRNETDCNVIAVRSKDALPVPPTAETVINAGDELILIGTSDAEKAFMGRYKG